MLKIIIQLKFCISLLILTLSQVSADTLTLAVANSTCNVIKQIGALYARKSGSEITYICKSSGRLAKGIKGQAIKADVYLSANKEWMDIVIKSKLVDSTKVYSPWGNELVVAVPNTSSLNLSYWDEITDKKIKTVLIGDPGTAPFGRYAKQALQNSNTWNILKKRLLTKKHITLLADRLSKADSNTIGILFATNIDTRHKVLLHIDESLHNPIRYYIAPVSHSKNDKNAEKFIKFILEEESQQMFQLAGFKIKGA